ncbi:hypothetical protein [Actinomadura sp. B10D3]|uniref:hypothetical protein n=1 Tax=Actinomadura sp. B10D3 TaxID=3153557 RepID=UPI00325D23EC
MAKSIAVASRCGSCPARSPTGLPGVLWIGGAAALVAALAVWTARGIAGLR